MSNSKISRFTGYFIIKTMFATKRKNQLVPRSLRMKRAIECPWNRNNKNAVCSRIQEINTNGCQAIVSRVFYCLDFCVRRCPHSGHKECLHYLIRIQSWEKSVANDKHMKFTRDFVEIHSSSVFGLGGEQLSSYGYLCGRYGSEVRTSLGMRAAFSKVVE